MELLQFLWEIVLAVIQLLWVVWPITVLLIVMGCQLSVTVHHQIVTNDVPLKTAFAV